MTIDQLAARDHAERLAVLDRAIAQQEKQIDNRIRSFAHSVDALRANLARLKAKRDDIAAGAQ